MQLGCGPDLSLFGGNCTLNLDNTRKLMDQGQMKGSQWLWVSRSVHDPSIVLKSPSAGYFLYFLFAFAEEKLLMFPFALQVISSDDVILRCLFDFIGQEGDELTIQANQVSGHFFFALMYSPFYLIRLYWKLVDPRLNSTKFASLQIAYIVPRLTAKRYACS